jgi:hypothetical protein
VPIDSVTVTEEVTGCRVPGERLDDLLRGPRSGRLLGDVEVNYATTIVGEHDEHEEDPEGDRGHSEEVH